MYIEIFDEKLNLFGLFLGEVTGWFYSKFSKIFVSFHSIVPGVKIGFKTCSVGFSGCFGNKNVS